ncbi:NAD(P)H-dependent oxidoreductase [Pseudomonas paraeruginosa]|uniref:NAD(P)H-dependent oxidoreductase n=2 Tax=Pseudomonas aeruginosa group TaxID=136841 RepID=UPI000D1B5391
MTKVASIHLITFPPVIYPLPDGEPEDETDRHDAVQMLARFLATNVIVIGAPMYNFSLPHAAQRLNGPFDGTQQSFRYGPMQLRA